MKSNRRGFTLIELIIVVIIIGILAAIAAPMMSGNVNRAKRAEAVAALGAIHTAIRLYYAEYTQYPAAVGLGNIGSGGTSANLGSYLKTTDLDGRYFVNNAYGIDASGLAYCNVTKSNDAGANASTPANITLDYNGALVQ